MKRLAFLAALILLPAHAMAQAPGTYIVKDSVYFTMDDGIQSPEEMEEEALYVKGSCESNAYQKLYFDCACLAGAFLQQREKLGPMTPQHNILEMLTKSRRATCANATQIAGLAYKDCLDYAAMSRELETDQENESYCACTGNKTAKDFARAPRFDIGYIRRVKSQAMSYCLIPENRARVSASAAPSPGALPTTNVLATPDSP